MVPLSPLGTDLGYLGSGAPAGSAHPGRPGSHQRCQRGEPAGGGGHAGSAVRGGGAPRWGPWPLLRPAGAARARQGGSPCMKLLLEPASTLQLCHPFRPWEACTLWRQRSPGAKCTPPRAAQHSPTSIPLLRAGRLGRHVCWLPDPHFFGDRPSEFITHMVATGGCGQAACMGRRRPALAALVPLLASSFAADPSGLLPLLLGAACHRATPRCALLGLRWGYRSLPPKTPSLTRHSPPPTRSAAHSGGVHLPDVRPPHRLGSAQLHPAPHAGGGGARAGPQRGSIPGGSNMRLCGKWEQLCWAVTTMQSMQRVACKARAGAGSPTS